MDISFLVRVDHMKTPITVLPPSADAYIRPRKEVMLRLFNHKNDKWIIVAGLSLGNIIFDSGWRRFLHANGIEEGDTIVFKHVAMDLFEVIFFYKKGSIKSTPAKADLPPYHGPIDFMT
ncbi:B3 domain-containing protein [Striga asiatica]|uniref:B3 domain-containing protein n=1 Tax=Striga asiatica TaxID=4170 RepID=A0A5A7PCW7_STRAF|nr:B3 domain-containing protein [Striga asiatica]